MTGRWWLHTTADRALLVGNSTFRGDGPNMEAPHGKDTAAANRAVTLAVPPHPR